MHVWTRRVVAVLSATALLMSLAGCASEAPVEGEPADAEPYRIGAVLSLTGTYAGLGGPEKNVIEMEVERINDAGGINGRPLEVLIEDDATDEAKAVAATSKLIEQDNVIAIIGASGTGQTMAMRGDLQRAGVPQISLAGGTVVTGQFDPLVFQTPWSNTLVVPFVLKAIKDAGHTKIGLISDTGGYGKDGRDVIMAEAPNVGVEIVSDQTFNAGDSDMTAQLTRIKSADADVLLIWNAGKEASIVAKGARDLGIDLPMFGGSGQARMEFIDGAGEASEGFVFGTGRSLIPANWGQGTPEYEAVTDFAARYEAQYGSSPDIFAGHAFDAMLLLADALQRAGAEADSAAVRDALEETSGVAGFGGRFTFSPTDHNGLTAEDLSLYRIDGAKWVTAQ